MLCLIRSGFRIGIVDEDVAPSCAVVVEFVFPRPLPRSSVSSDPRGDGGSGVIGLGPISSVKALASPSPDDERVGFSNRGSMLFSSLGSVLSVY